MENKINSIVKKFRSDRIRRRRFTALMTVLSMVVSSSVFWQLRSTGNALTDDYLCGMTEHVHSAECFSEELICTEDHEHTDECTVIVMNCDETVHTHSMQCMSDISADVESAEDWEKTLPDTLTDNFSENLIAVASSQLGYSESVRNFVLDSDSVRRGYTRYGQWYGSRYGEWNTMFTYFCLYYAGITEKIMPYGSGCWAWTETLSEAGLLTAPDSGEIKVGDLVFFDTNADDRPDRSGIVSAISKPDDEEDSPQTITVIEGDLDDKVDTAEYSIEDEKLVGFVSIDKLAESDMDFLTSSPEDEELSESDMELPMLSFGDSEIAAYASNGNPDVKINGTANYTTENDPFVVTAGSQITFEVSLQRLYGSDTSTAYYTHKNNAQLHPKYEDEKYAEKDWYYYDGDSTQDGVTTHDKNFFSPANIYSLDQAQWGNGTQDRPAVIDGQPYVYKKTYTIPSVTADTTYHFVYNNCDVPDAGVEDIYIKVVPDTSTPVSQPTGIKIIAPKEEANNYQTEASTYRLRPNESVTIQASVGSDKYTRYASLEEYNRAKENNKNDKELRFAQIGNTYISTYARFWGTDKGAEAGTSTICKSSYTTYSMNGDNLVATVTYSANDIKYNQNNKYYATFIDNKNDYNTIEQFWINVEVPIISVYTNVGWKDKDLIHEAMEGKGGDTDGGKYWSNADVKETEGGSFAEGQYYIVHPNDWIYLSGIGNGTFGNLRQIHGAVDDSNGMILENNVDPPNGDKSGKTNIWKLTMPSTSSGKAYYAVDYTIGDSTQTFYFMFSNTGLWGVDYYDHADFEIADGGIYEMISQHYVKPDGTEIKTVRTYDSYVQDVRESKVFDSSKTLVGNYFWGDYSKQGNIGETQFEYTSKYKTDGNQNRLEPTEGSNGFPPSHTTDEYLKTWSRVNTDSAEFTVDILLRPKSEVTIIKYPDGREEQLLTDSQTLSTYEEMTVKNVKIDLDRQSVIDAVNKCPDHSGLDFTILDETLTSKLRSGSVLIEAYKRFKDEQGNVYDLVGGEFEFELYEYDPTTKTETLVSSSTNVTEGYVYFDNQFYIDLDMSDDDPKEFYYRIKEKIPEQRDEDITYSVRVENVKVTVTPTVTSDGIPTYETKVEYLNMNDDPEYKHTYTPKDKDHNPTGEADRTIPAFVNIKKTYAYTLPNTGGSGTTMFFILGPMLMLGSAVIAIRRKRKERV